MKRRALLTGLISVLIGCLIVLAACDDPTSSDEGEGTFTINLGAVIDSGQSRSTWPYPPRDVKDGNIAGPSLSDLNFIIYFTPVSGGNGVETFTFRGDRNLSDRIPVGTYTVSMQVYHVTDTSYSDLYALGGATGSVTIIAGQNAQVTVTLIDANAGGSPIKVVVINEDTGTTTGYPHLQAAFAAISDAGNYTVLVEDHGTARSRFGGTDVRNISLRPLGAAAEIQLESNEPLISIAANVTLTLEAGITLKGLSTNNTELVIVDTNGTLNMRSGSLITGNTGSARGGMGVYVFDSGTFTMFGGEISNNSTCGVFVRDSVGTFTMFGGEISNHGGYGVSHAGTFTMHGGVISNNNFQGVRGSGTFNMHGGEILNNNFQGVSTAGSLGTFNMFGGVISGNTVTGGGGNGGGGVYMASSATFNMHGGTISGNTVTGGGGNGGGVYIAWGTFNMFGGEIFGNTATNRGGGVYVESGGTFLKGPAGTGTGSGIIYGENEGGKSNTANAATNQGHAVYVNANTTTGRLERVRNSTIGENTHLDSEVDAGW
ncbi:MAG: right-handed parallel beta-helix repeat-containing protein [Treponema sp.]|nr:right-handed parallel beta-helix repeat-containing protein [Treponema sp.]